MEPDILLNMSIFVGNPVQRRFPVTTFGMQNVIFATTALLEEGGDEVLLLIGCNDIAVGRVVLSHREILGAMDAASPVSGA